MAIEWPTSLQDCLNGGSWTESPVDTAIRNDPSTGPNKSRQRYTQPERTITGTIWLKGVDQYNTFKDFFDLSLQGGILEFDFEHPITKVLTTYVFNEPYAINNQFGGDVYPVSMKWKEQP